MVDPAGPHRRFRILTEAHVPFAVSDNLDWLGRRGQFDLVVAAGWLPRELEAYVREGGRLLVAGPTPPPLDLGRVVRRWESTTSCYFRVRDRGLFPSLRSTELVWLNGPYAELEPPARPLLTLVGPSMFGPPEKVHIDQTETDKPGLILRDYGKGRLAWLPWDLGRLYYYHSSPVHAGVLADLVDHLLSRGRQVRTNAHLLVEITVMRQQGRRLVQLVNVSGHSSTGYFAPLPMSDLRVAVAGSFGRVRALRAGVTLDVRPADGVSEFTLPRLADYELVVVE